MSNLATELTTEISSHHCTFMVLWHFSPAKLGIFKCSALSIPQGRTNLILKIERVFFSVGLKAEWNPTLNLVVPQDDRWRLHGATQSGPLGLTHSHYWALGRGLQHSAQPCWPRQCEAASASSCLWHLRPQSVSATPGPLPARMYNKGFGLSSSRFRWVITVWVN